MIKGSLPSSLVTQMWSVDWLCTCGWILLLSPYLAAQEISPDYEGGHFPEHLAVTLAQTVSDSIPSEEESPGLDSVHRPAKMVYDYRTFQQYTVAAVKYEAEMLERLNKSQSEYDDLRDRMLQAKSAGDKERADMIEHQLARKSWKLEDDRRVVAYARNLVKKILRIGKYERYKRLAKIYIPGLDRVDRNLVTEDLKSREQAIVVEAPTAIIEDTSTQEAEVAVGLQSDRSDEGIESPSESAGSPRAMEVHRIPLLTDLWTQNPPESTCEYGFQGLDGTTGELKTELASEFFFAYTDPRLKSYLKDQDYIYATAYLSSLAGGFRYLTLTIVVNAMTAQTSYGRIKKGSLMNILLMNGKIVSLFASNESLGTLDKKEGRVSYEVRYPIDYQKDRLLSKSEVNRVRIIWSSGYEEYDVTNVDLVMNQLHCLNSK